MATSTIKPSASSLQKLQNIPTGETFNVNGITGKVCQGCMNVSVTLGVTSSYNASEIVPSNAKKVWIDGGFLDLGTSYLPINFTDGTHLNRCWYDDGKVYITSNAWSGTAYVILKYIV